ncbi:ATP-binding protein [bacterium]|nr:ATP-binding protein [bacterium]
MRCIIMGMEAKKYIKRDVLEEIKPWLGKEKILILKGARQVGKTTILNHLKMELEKAQKKVIYYAVDLEINNPFWQEPKLFIKFVKEQFADQYIYIILDEFQYIKQSGLFLKVVFDQLKEQVQLIVSGSSSLEITKNTEYLTGRKIAFAINPFSFKEYIRAKSELKLDHLFTLHQYPELEEFNQIYKSPLKSMLTDYLLYGGYPEVILENNFGAKNIIIKELINTYIQKDISGFLKIENTSAFNNLIRLLVSQNGNMVNKLELSNSLNLSYETLNKYLDILVGTYVFNLVRPFYTNVRKEISKMPKIYLNDLSLKKVLLKEDDQLEYDFAQGSVIENFAFLELRQKFALEDIYFYRTVSKSEIDWVVQDQQQFILLEVKFTNKPPSEKLVQFTNFATQYPQVKLKIILTKDVLSFNPKNNIYFIPVYLLPFINL